MFESSKDFQKKDNFLKQTEDARQKRLLEKKKLQSAVKIQSFYRGYIVRKKLLDSIEDELKNKLLSNHTLDLDRLAPNYAYNSNPSSQLLALVKKYLFVYNKRYKNKKDKLDISMLKNLLDHLVCSITQGEFKYSYVSLIMNKNNYQNFINQSRQILCLCVSIIDIINLKNVVHLKLLYNIIELIFSLTDFKAWKCFKVDNNPLIETLLKETNKSFLIILFNENLFQKFNNILIQNSANYHPILEKRHLSNILIIAFKILELKNFDESSLKEFSNNLVTIPLIFDQHHEFIKQKSAEFDLLNKLFIHLNHYERLKSFLNNKDINLLIFFLGNLCSLSKMNFDILRSNTESLLNISSQIFLNSNNSGTSNRKKSDKNDTIRWHPIFGFLKVKSSFGNFEIIMSVMDQLRFLWSHQFISILFDSKNVIFQNNINYTTSNSSGNVNFKEFVKGFFDKTLNTRQNNLIDSSESSSIFRICSFYRQLLLFFSEPRIEILSALSIEEELLLGLWHYLNNLGPMCGLNELLKIVQNTKDFHHQVFDVLYIVCSLVLYLVAVLDENEFYEQQKIFKLNDYKLISNFLNNLIYKILANELLNQDPSKTLQNNTYFSIFHQLLVALYMKDNRRAFSNDVESFWLVKDLKPKTFMIDLEKDKKYALNILEYIPHIIPLKNRIEILKSKIDKDKHVFHGSELPQVRINIRRYKLIEDAYANLASLPVNLLKSTLRISFINECGLREAGIDQDGVFKEFLQETIKQILDPKFNLFQVTNEQQLYPSPSSYFVEDHLQMFEFAGKLIAKSIYEGQVVEVDFAPFFLRQLIGYRTQYFSFLDDLATLDKDLYKNLNSIKHDENVADLELTFCHSEYHLGKLISHELVPSGSYVKVTDENKIKYIHLLAHFKLHKQIKDQVNAFNDGFKSIIKQEWLNMFSLPEIQRLISGCTQDINLEDLKRNVQYFNGLHSNHRLVKWLWEVIENDFTKEERSLFLKFVTSSSKPPLLGFSSLNPPFSIRCVDNEEEDGTVFDSSLRSFLKTVMNISKNDTSRLPTSSTCFNLLKIPNYSKKSTLKEKLRYAINSNSGFELS